MLSFGIVRSGTFALELSLWDFRFGTCAQEFSLRNLSLETFVLGNFRSRILALLDEDVSLAIFRDLSFGNLGQLGLSLGIVRLRTSV